MVFGNSNFPKVRNCPDTVLNTGGSLSFSDFFVFLSRILNKISDERRLAAAPVSINPLALISKINMGILRRGGIICCTDGVKLWRVRSELMATGSQFFNSDGMVG